jgi:GH25 family lysozyme M1 (1,4-beta-N-acetylmuramidase)
VIIGCDIAEYQPDWTPAADEEFVIIKATLGMTVTDPKRARHAQVARDAGLVVGFYHFGWPSTHSGTGAEQADYFLDNIPDLRPGELLVYDWEPSNDGEPSVKDRDSFLNRLRDQMPGYRIGLYANPSNFRADPVADWVFAWPAWWTTSPGPPDLDGKDWTLWQYTDHPYDHDRGNFNSREAMRNWAVAAGVPSSGLFGMTEQIYERRS